MGWGSNFWRLIVCLLWPVGLGLEMAATSFYSCDSVTHEGQTNTWFTPKEVVTALGPFDLDPCTQTFRPHDTATRHICEDAGECGLAAEWSGRVWLNPPYGKTISRWLEKLAKHGNGIALVFSRTETKWGQAMIEQADGVNFLKGRIAFIREDGQSSTNAANGSLLLAFGRENVEAIRLLPGVVFARSA
jgi:hypothetical protein